MARNDELKELAWKRLWADHWFGRLFGGGLLLGLCGSAVNTVLRGILGRLGVQSWFEYAGTVAQNWQDVTTPVPNLTPEYMSQASSSTVLTLFFSFIMTGIASYGAAVILRKCVANDEKEWLGEAFGGFKNPFGMMWLQLRYWLIWFAYGLVAFFVPGLVCGLGYPFVKDLPMMQLALAVGVGTTACLCWATWILCIPFYRYRYLWLVKAEHPDWGAGQCIRFCKTLTEGHKMESFRLDCSYWKPITLLMLALAGAATIGSLAVLFKDSGLLLSALALVAFVALSGSLVGSVVLGQYISVGQGFLYRDLKDGQKTE